MTSAYEHLFKIKLIGDAGSGRSSIMMRYFDDLFNIDNYLKTISVAFKIRTVVRGGKRLKLQVWEDALPRKWSGQFVRSGATAPQYRGCHGVMLLWDLTDKKHFENLRLWIDEVERYSGESVNLVVVGTKCDLITKRAVSEQDVRAFLQQTMEQVPRVCNRIAYVETSARCNINVELAFEVLAFEILRRVRGCTKECEPAFVVARERRWQRGIHSQCAPDVQERVHAIMCVWALHGEGSGLAKLPVEVLELILVMAHADGGRYSDGEWAWDDSLLASPRDVGPSPRCAVC
eukprot:TRINITY_DN2014_c0_g2_i4.p1 TRINITY_DN2014_c0_g2~~TRINITY_DN2014_c0_g2_i4.p1  ORF type:complete len:290 (-),score=39.29 TRINITY_DN2014_c0_g2_i4:895-1764(-)